MEKRVLILEKEKGWSIFDAIDGEALKEGLGSVEESLRLCEKEQYVAPYRGGSGNFFKDVDGEFLYHSKRGVVGDVELEYADGTLCLDFEICPSCKGPAFGGGLEGNNCYYCPSCKKEINCVPPAEWIGELD